MQYTAIPSRNENIAVITHNTAGPHQCPMRLSPGPSTAAPSHPPFRRSVPVRPGVLSQVPSPLTSMAQAVSPHAAPYSAAARPVGDGSGGKGGADPGLPLGSGTGGDQERQPKLLEARWPPVAPRSGLTPCGSPLPAVLRDLAVVEAEAAVGALAEAACTLFPGVGGAGCGGTRPFPAAPPARPRP